MRRLRTAVPTKKKGGGSSPGGVPSLRLEFAGLTVARLSWSKPSAVLLGASCLAWVAFVWLWELGYLTLSVDDSFYYLQIARRVAAGEGFSFDGLNPTNGFHPLWLLVLSGLAWLVPADAELLMRAALTLQILMVWGGVELLGRAHRPMAPWIRRAASLLLLHFYFAKSLVNGMESALCFLLIAGTLAVWAGRPERSLRATVALGVLLGLCVLARLESLLFSLGVLVLSLDGVAGALRGRNRWMRQAALWLVPLVIIIAYLVTNRTMFGHWLPVSAVIKSEVGLGGFGPHRLVNAGLVSVVAIGLGFSVLRAGRESARGAFLRLWVPVAVYAFGGAILYQLVVGGMPPIWYLTPWAVLLVFTATLLLSSAGVRRSWRPAVKILALLWLVWSGLGWRHRLDPRSYSAYLGARENGRWLAANTEDSSLAAGWAGGVTASHSRRRFVNLDGLANSWEYKRSFRDRGRVQTFIDQVWPVDYLALRLDLESLDHYAEVGYRGVEIGSWSVARAECVEFQSALRSRSPRSLVYVVLARQPAPGLERYDRFARTAGGGCSAVSRSGDGP